GGHLPGSGPGPGALSGPDRGDQRGEQWPGLASGGRGAGIEPLTVAERPARLAGPALYAGGSGAGPGGAGPAAGRRLDPGGGAATGPPVALADPGSWWAPPAMRLV